MTSPLPYRADYHMHTKWSNHATGEMRDYVEAAVGRGLTQIGFSVHMPVTIPIDEKLCLTRGEMEFYVAELRRLQREYAGRIDILMGGECDHVPGQEAEIEEVIAAYPFDYIIGSVHFIDGWSFDNPSQRVRWDAEDVATVYRRYYELVVQAAQTGYYDIFGHFDLVKKFGYRPESDVGESEAAAADAAARAGMAVEINTAGLDAPAGEQYPSERILHRLNERDVPITFGSDAHRPEHVARHFDRARALACRLGFSAVARYKARRTFPEPLLP